MCRTRGGCGNHNSVVFHYAASVSSSERWVFSLGCMFEKVPVVFIGSGNSRVIGPIEMGVVLLEGQCSLV